MRKLFGIDVGGTEIKTGIVSVEDEISIVETGVYPSCSQKSKAAIIDNFKLIFEQLTKAHGTPCGIAMAFPGDFDYQNGVCLMKGVGKYDAIYGVSMKEEFAMLFESKALCGLKEKPLYFINDVSAFARGVSMDMPQTKCERTLCVCIGTGCGSAFLVNGRVVGDEVLGVPKNGWICNMPYRDSIIDDYLSKRGLTAITQSLLGREVEGLALSILAKGGDAKAIESFICFGEQVADALKTVITLFQPDRIILGGQIAKSFALFGQPLSKLCNTCGIKLNVITETSQYALKGLSVFFTIDVKNTK